MIFFNIIPLKNSARYILHSLREINWWVFRSAFTENIVLISKVLKKSVAHKMKKGKRIISREGFTAFLFWSLLHFQPWCDHSQIMLSGNKSQTQQQLSSSLLLLSFSLFFSNLFLGGWQKEMVCTWYWCVGTPVWDLIREPLERCLFKSVHVHSEQEQVKAIRYNAITFLEKRENSFTLCFTALLH